MNLCDRYAVEHVGTKLEPRSVILSNITADTIMLDNNDIYVESTIDQSIPNHSINVSSTIKKDKTGRTLEIGSAIMPEKLDLYLEDLEGEELAFYRISKRDNSEPVLSAKVYDGKAGGSVSIDRNGDTIIGDIGIKNEDENIQTRLFRFTPKTKRMQFLLPKLDVVGNNSKINTLIGWKYGSEANVLVIRNLTSNEQILIDLDTLETYEANYESV